ncbi:hypothetical protein C8Q74DRAFT_1221169 [Fomes fomentarius]|nr:hypothetical protein C8Q74DRAFT_1221169 [Fomes fomentarius]
MLVRDGVMVKKFQISQNLSLDGTEEFFNSCKVTDAGNVDLIDDRGDECDLEDRMDTTMHNAQHGDLSKRKYRQEVRQVLFYEKGVGGIVYRRVDDLLEGVRERATSGIGLIARGLPLVYVDPLVRFVPEHIERSPHVEFDLLWAIALLGAHGRHLRDKAGEPIRPWLGNVCSSGSTACHIKTGRIAERTT